MKLIFEKLDSGENIHYGFDRWKKMGSVITDARAKRTSSRPFRYTCPPSFAHVADLRNAASRFKRRFFDRVRILTGFEYFKYLNFIRTKSLFSHFQCCCESNVEQPQGSGNDPVRIWKWGT